MSEIRKLAVSLVFLFAIFPAHADVFLYMAEEDGCYWCQQWDKEIGKVYPKTVEGKTAPLKKYDLLDGPPNGIELKFNVSYTPTFILVENNQEVARIEGYPGEDFFWGLLGEAIGNAKIPLAN